jgi:putative acetyltransferase
VNIRPATNDDSEAIKTLVFSVLREYGLSPDSGNTDRDLDEIEETYFRRGGYFGVVIENNRIVACVGLYLDTYDTCDLRKMYCLPVSRGKGLGRKLLEFSIAKARELSFSRITLETASRLKEAISLYQKYGFVSYSPDHLSARCDQAFELYL